MDKIELLREIERLEGLVYSPGLYKCDKCGLSLTAKTLYAGDGSVSANEAPQQCMNDCGQMRRVTERERADENYVAAEQQMKRALEAERKLARQLLPAPSDPELAHAISDIENMEAMYEAAAQHPESAQHGFCGLHDHNSASIVLAAYRRLFSLMRTLPGELESAVNFFETTPSHRDEGDCKLAERHGRILASHVRSTAKGEWT